MTEWAPKRFWTEVSVRQQDDGWAVYLDERAVKTPAKRGLIAPTPALGNLVAAEWQAQADTVDPDSMPFTRSLNAALDKVAPNPGPVAEMLGSYAETDLLCYRATEPAELVARQARIWDPYLDWVAATYDARLAVTSGIMPVSQPAAAIQNLTQAVHDLGPFELTAAHDLVTLTGSLVLGLAALTAREDAEALWAAARLDELWQIEQWGPDDEAEALAESKKAAFLHALSFRAASQANA